MRNVKKPRPARALMPEVLRLRPRTSPPPPIVEPEAPVIVLFHGPEGSTAADIRAVYEAEIRRGRRAG